jgi:4-hydroxybenzoyl-CoA reductase subunit beta
MAGTFTFGASVAEVRIDPETGKVIVPRFTSAHDCGRAINPMAVEGQMEGSIQQTESVAKAIALYSEYQGKAQYLSGGTDLIPTLKQRLSSPAAVIDLKGIEEMQNIAGKKGWLAVGANVTLFSLKNDPRVVEYFPALYQSLDATACETLQLRGTIGGNILQNTRCIMYNKSLEWRTACGFCLKMGGGKCNVVPGGRKCFSNYCSDNAPALITLSAEVKLAGPGGERKIKLEKIFSGEGEHPFTLKPGEILTQILIPMGKTKGTYKKLRVRDSMDYPLVGVAVSVKGSAAKVCVGGVGPAPLVYDLKGLDEHTVKEAAQKAHGDAKTVANTTLSALYRKKMVGVLVKRAFSEALQEGK